MLPFPAINNDNSHILKKYFVFPKSWDSSTLTLSHARDVSPSCIAGGEQRQRVIGCHPQRHQKTMSKGELRPKRKSAPSPTPVWQRPSFQVNRGKRPQGRSWVSTDGCGKKGMQSSFLPLSQISEASVRSPGVPLPYHSDSVAKSSLLNYKNCRRRLLLERSAAAREEEIRHVEYRPACYNLTSLAQTLSRKRNAPKYLLSHLGNKAKTLDSQLHASFFQFPRQTGEEGLVLIMIQTHLSAPG